MKAFEKLKGTDVYDIGYYQWLDWDLFDDEVKESLKAEGYTEYMALPKEVIDRHDLWELVEDYDYDKDALMQAFEGVIKSAPHYLVMAHNCKWNGASGYMIVDSLSDAFYRGYDVSLKPLKISRGGKCTVFQESSHDVPTGALTSVIALTEHEFRKFTGSHIHFEDVENFARRCEERTA